MTETLESTCCIVGGGPAGMMLGYLLARAGVDVTVLEKHADFFRDFRGDTVHPSTLEVMHELGLLEDFLKIPHQQLTSVGGVFGDFPFEAANFRHVPTRCKFVALMPQWDFLNFLASRAKAFPNFQLRLQNEAVDLIREEDRIRGVEARTRNGAARLRADLVIGCDGRHSTTRQAAQLAVKEFGVPMDVLWFRLSRHANDPERLFGNINYGRALVLINRGEYYQAGLIVRKDSFDELKRQGLASFRRILLKVAPYLGNSVDELRDWDQVKLLSVRVNRLEQWHRPGLLCIGDAAHAMSPAGGVGINLAIQDAVATANLLARPLREGRVTEALLAQVQRRRMLPTRVTQRMQVNAHKGLKYVFQHPGPLTAPWQMKVLVRVPGLQHVMGRAIGVGVRPEHVNGAANRRSPHQGWIKGIACCAGIVTAIAVAAKRFCQPGNSSARIVID
ncbi:MAG TPA: FAD-dependent oxidoreductase [Bryobacteraceae bacterium]|jgi:2-polyprenyl-6-methoxyphenol hydroxylase-like FAD-dependent oxidoreductase|nr:FAD-dependent oxidoreductase [Bryobacteraceae bacterium]